MGFLIPPEIILHGIVTDYETARQVLVEQNSYKMIEYLFASNRRATVPQSLGPCSPTDTMATVKVAVQASNEHMV